MTILVQQYSLTFSFLDTFHNHRGRSKGGVLGVCTLSSPITHETRLQSFLSGVPTLLRKILDWSLNHDYTCLLGLQGIKWSILEHYKHYFSTKLECTLSLIIFQIHDCIVHNLLFEMCITVSHGPFNWFAFPLLI